MKGTKERKQVTSAEEEKIKAALRSDIRSAAAEAGDWQEIADSAYESGAHVRRSTLSFVLPAVCAAVLAVSLGALQMFSEYGYDFRHEPAAAVQTGSADVSDEEASGITSLKTRYSTTADGYPDTGNYLLDMKVYFPHKDGYTDYGRLYIFAVCEGRTVYTSSSPVSYTAGKEKSVSITFSFDTRTQSDKPEVGVAAVFLRDGDNGENCESAIQTISLLNPCNSESDLGHIYQLESGTPIYDLHYHYGTPPTMDMVTYEEDRPAFRYRVPDGAASWLTFFEINSGAAENTSLVCESAYDTDDGGYTDVYYEYDSFFDVTPDMLENAYSFAIAQSGSDWQITKVYMPKRYMGSSAKNAE